jgi:hypothetical protein
MCTSSLLERGFSLRPCSSIERFDALAVRPQDPFDPLAYFRRRFEPRDGIGFRVITDVLDL